MIAKDYSRKQLILLGFNRLLPLTERRYNLIISSYTDIVEAHDDGFNEINQKDFKVVRDFFNNSSEADLLSVGNSVVEEMQSENLLALFEGDLDYPFYLNRLEDKPVILFAKGNIALLNDHNSVAVAGVGSRKASHQTKAIIQKMTTELVGLAPIIVSGLAEGVDEIVHQSAIENQLSCIGVLGTSLFEQDYYPKVTLKTSHKIIENGGVIISSYDKGFKGNKFSFVRRNRLISALSYLIIVWQASRNSGSCRTGEYALEMNKKVFVVPGLPYDPNYQGCKELIHKGAFTLMDSSDITACFQKEGSVKNFNAELESKPESPIAQKIYNLLSFEGINSDEILHKTSLSISQLNYELGVLEIEGWVKNIGSNYWIRIR